MTKQGSPLKIMAWPSEIGANTGEWSANQFFSDHAVEYVRSDLASVGDYVPGVWRCAKCQFELIQSALNAGDGTVTANDKPGAACPNCNVPLWRVSWKVWATEACERLDATFDEAQSQKALLKAALHALRSYENGNSATDLAESVANKISAALEP